MVGTPWQRLSWVVALAVGFHAHNAFAGEAWCWGERDGGKVHAAVPSGAAIPGPMPLLENAALRTLALGSTFSCGLGEQGQALCWGLFPLKKVDDNGRQESNASAFGKVSGPFTLTSLAAGFGHFCGITDGRRVVCGGSNEHGQLGDGSTEEPLALTPVKTDMEFSFVSAGVFHSCAIAFDGTAYCWGANDHSQLGRDPRGGSDTEEPIELEPVEVAGGLHWIDISAGLDHSCGLVAEGEAYCWGANESGQLGDGSLINRSSPQAVKTNLRFTKIHAAYGYTCALAKDQRAYCWGNNSSGNLGVGDKQYRSFPTPVSGQQQYIQLSAGVRHACALTDQGVAYCWGDNTYGALGNAADEDSNIPVKVISVKPFSMISAGDWHSCALAR